MCTLTGYRRHLDGRSPDTKSPPAWLVVATGLRISLPKKGPRYPKSIPFQNWPLSMRAAFAPQIRWRIRAALTCGVGYALDPVKISREAFGLSARAVAAGSRLKPASRVEKVESSNRALPQSSDVAGAPLMRAQIRKGSLTNVGSV